jgi:hypothetical protein
VRTSKWTAVFAGLRLRSSLRGGTLRLSTYTGLRSSLRGDRRDPGAHGRAPLVSLGTQEADSNGQRADGPVGELGEASRSACIKKQDQTRGRQDLEPGRTDSSSETAAVEASFDCLVQVAPGEGVTIDVCKRRHLPSRVSGSFQKGQRPPEAYRDIDRTGHAAIQVSAGCSKQVGLSDGSVLLTLVYAPWSEMNPSSRISPS